MPHVFIILLIIMLFVVVLSYIVPSGSYERLTNEAGISVIDPDTFQYVENENPIRFLNYFEAVYNGFVNGATIMGTLFISSGVIYLLEVSGSFGAGINAILKKTKGKEFSVVCIFYTIFVIFGVLGYGEAAYPFYPLAVTIGFALGYDRMVGTGLAIVGSTVGFTSGLMNTFTTGVAQQIVGLPLFSGIGFRAVGLAGMELHVVGRVVLIGMAIDTLPVGAFHSELVVVNLRFLEGSEVALVDGECLVGHVGGRDEAVGKPGVYGFLGHVYGKGAESCPAAVAAGIDFHLDVPALGGGKQVAPVVEPGLDGSAGAEDFGIRGAETGDVLLRLVADEEAEGSDIGGDCDAAVVGSDAGRLLPFGIR